MELLKLFLRFELSRRINYLKTKKVAKLITGALFMLVFLFVAAGIYTFFVSGFLYIHSQVEEDVRQAITLFIYEMFLLVLGALIVFSAVVTGMFNLFRNDSSQWLLSSPSYKLWPKIVLLRTILASLLPMGILFLPALLAYGKVVRILTMRNLPHADMLPFGFIELLLILSAVTLVLVSINALSLIFITLTGTLYRYLAKSFHGMRVTFGRFMGLLLITGTAAALAVWQNVRSVDLVRIFKAYETSQTISLDTISSHFSYLPSHPLALMLVSLESGNPVFAPFTLIILVAIVTTASWFFVSFLHFPLWKKLQENYSHEGGSAWVARGTRYTFEGGKIYAIFKKEALITTRNLKGVAWFAFLFGIWLIQIATNKILGKNIIRYDPDINHKLIVLQTIEFVIALYFICAFALRFVFPSFSVEKKTAWILKSAPLDFKKIFLGKYFFYSFLFLVTGILMAYISQLALSLPLENGLYGMALFITAVIFIVTLALSLGVYLPSTESDDPENITTSIGGLFFTALSLLYGAGAAFVLNVSLKANHVAPIAIFSAISVVVVIVMIMKSARKSLTTGV